jgi:hypothetical protein
MRPTNIFNKNRRKKRGTGNFNSYKQQAAAEYKQALERLLLGSSGCCVAGQKDRSGYRRVDGNTKAAKT